MKNCVFCEMPKSEISRVIYEDKVCRVMLSRYQVERGHLLVVSKKHYADIFSTPDSVVTHSFRVAKRFGKLVKAKMKCKGLDIGVNVGIKSSVHHFHIHILPRYTTRAIHFRPGKNEIHKSEVVEITRLFGL